MEFTREKAGPNHESLGTTRLYVNDKVVAEGPMRAQVGKFTLSGDGLCIGYDSGDAISKEYKTPGEFHGGTILGVGVTTEKRSTSTWRRKQRERSPGTRRSKVN
jgi:arylsulfatase